MNGGFERHLGQAVNFGTCQQRNIKLLLVTPFTIMEKKLAESLYLRSQIKTGQTVLKKAGLSRPGLRELTLG